MNTRTLGALPGAVLVSLVLGCGRDSLPSAPLASKATRPAPNFSASDDEQEMRWDIINIDAAGVISAGGMASALADDGSKITFTGSGTFKGDGEDDVTGGGTWTLEKTGTPAVTGTYRVKQLVRFEPAAGTLPAGLVDRIGNAADARAGLAILQIRYSDGSRGILVVSCQFEGTPPTVFEGVTATKGSATFWNRSEHNFTEFHVMSDEVDENDERD